MKYFTFSFYIKSSNVPSRREPFPPPNPRNSGLSDVTFLAPPHSAVMYLLMHLCACPINWALPKDRAHIYFILHWVPGT